LTTLHLRRERVGHYLEEEGIATVAIGIDPPARLEGERRGYMTRFCSVNLAELSSRLTSYGTTLNLDS